MLGQNNLEVVTKSLGLNASVIIKSCSLSAFLEGSDFFCCRKAVTDCLNFLSEFNELLKLSKLPVLQWKCMLLGNNKQLRLVCKGTSFIEMFCEVLCCHTEGCSGLKLGNFKPLFSFSFHKSSERWVKDAQCFDAGESTDVFQGLPSSRDFHSSFKENKQTVNATRGWQNRQRGRVNFSCHPGYKSHQNTQC